jgi:hypothetical protein
MRKSPSRSAAALSSLLLLLAAGCPGSGTSFTTYPVKGHVLLANGKPLTKGRVTFVADDGLRPPASGELGSDGGFTLSTGANGEGAAPGQYKVRIEPVSAPAPATRAVPPRFPMKYIDEDSSGLTVVVKAEPNELQPITLK